MFYTSEAKPKNNSPFLQVLQKKNLNKSKWVVYNFKKMIVTGIITLLAKSQLFALSQWLPILNDLKSVWQYCPGFPANQFIFYTSMAYNQQRKFSAIRIGLLSVIFWTSLWFMKNLTQWWHFFFFFHFPPRCLIFMFEGNMGSVDPTSTKINQFREILINSFFFWYL